MSLASPLTAALPRTFLPRGDNEVFISQGGGGGEGAVAAQRVLLRAAEKGVTVPSFPGAVGRGKKGEMRQHGKWVVQKVDVGCSVVF